VLRLRRLALGVPVVLGLAWVGVVAERSARADALMLEGSREMAAWTAGRMDPSEGNWRQVREKLEGAEGIEEMDPSTHELLGILYGIRLGDPEYVRAARVHLKRALALRPTSPYTWANLAEGAYLTGDTGSAFELALNRSADLGPAEPEVQRIVVDYGLAMWNELTPSTRASVERMLNAGLRRKPLEMLQISERRGRLAFACRHLVGSNRAPDPKWYQLCQSTEATP